MVTSNSNMVDLLVVGNGFDLALGAHTRYTDFFYALDIAASSDTYVQFCEHLFAYLKETDAYHRDIYERNGLYALFEKIKYTKHNFFVRYLLNRRDMFEEWSGLEQALKEMLIAFDHMLANIKEENLVNHSFFIIPDIKKHGTCLLYDKRIIALWNGIIFDQQKNFKEGKVSIPIINTLDAPNFNEYIQPVKKKVCQDLLQEFDRFVEVFAFYINVFGLVPSLFVDRECDYKKVINYNYTRNAELTYNLREEEVMYIHGTYEPLGPMTRLKYDIVVGIDDYKFQNQGLNKFKKTSQRRDIIKRKDLYEFLKGVNTVHVYGHSLDYLDRDTLSVILKSVKNKVIYIYHKDLEDSEYEGKLRALLPDEDLFEAFETGRIKFKDASEKRFNMFGEE